MRNETVDDSSIRFGGYDEDRLRRGHDVIFIKTGDNRSWQIPLKQVDFDSDNLLDSPTKALINPGFPYIASPKADFDKFKDDLRKAFPVDPIQCISLDWCYFETECDLIVGKIPPLKFTFGDDSLAQTYEVPPESFLLPEIDYTGTEVCHLTVIGQD